MSQNNKPTSEEPEEKPPSVVDDEVEDELEDEVDEAGEESFPASDAPPWTAAAAAVSVLYRASA